MGLIKLDFKPNNWVFVRLNQKNRKKFDYYIENMISIDLIIIYLFKMIYILLF